MAARNVAQAAPAKTRRVAAPAKEGEAEESSYFASGAEGKSELIFVSSGCSVMDEALGGGYVVGRTVNIVGDKSAGKTLCAMELCANFAMQFPKGALRYAESEAAFDQPYAGALGIPLPRITFNQQGKPLETVEDLYEDMEAFLDRHKGVPKLYIIDSLDALSDDAEIDGEFNKASYGGAKPKAIGQLFRRLIQRMEDEQMMFVVVSQIRDKLNAGPFQETKTRSGGKALDFYATHIVWLAEIKKLKRTIAKIERVVGVDVKARVRKNKVGLPFRECEYPILFGYGIDDMTACVEWLIANNCEKHLATVGLSKAGHSTLLTKLRNEGGQGVRDMRAKLAAIVRVEWGRIEQSFLPKSSKY